ncbi:hypothetical protein Q1695_013467 [Nippostrongylus brasiliensis]|nr:hypothetical protein Q1695_013467 [Nippostrongylus brasiliensis]
MMHFGARMLDSAQSSHLASQRSNGPLSSVMVPLEGSQEEVLMAGLILLVIAAAVGFGGTVRYSSSMKTGNTVTIDVFGESRCIHTTMFLRQQLLPAYKLFGSRLRVRYYPFGVTRYTRCDWNGPHMECYCQHGPRECEKNTLQACVMSYLPDTDDHLELISCIQGSAEFNDTVESCLTDKSLKYRVNRDWLVRCAQSDAGRSLMSHYGRLQNSKEPFVTWVPWIMINGVRDEEAERQLSVVLCTRYFKTPPTECAPYVSNSKEI